jgi:hypothetical protein
MNYDLARQGKPLIAHDIYNGMDWGELPSSILTSKFEETDLGPDENVYDNYARNTISDWRPDAATLAHEAPRGGVNRSKGFLQLRSDGHRGIADVEKPEIFLGFGGPEDWDPRGVVTDPDFKQIKRQHESRMRFQSFDPDMMDHITSGGRSESMVMSDLQKLIRVKRDRLKIFDRQLDGRRTGMRRNHSYKSDVSKQVIVQSYGDLIRDYGLNPQRRTNVIAKQILRDTREYRDETADQDFEFARYSQICRRAALNDTFKRVLYAQGSAEGDWTDADTSRAYKAAGILMSNLIRGKKQIMNNMAGGGIDYASSKEAVARKTAPFARDLTFILQSIAQDGDFKSSDTTNPGKTPHPQMADHLARQIVFNHLTPAHHFLNAEVIYKNVKPGADISKIKSLIITDATNPEIRDEQTIAGKMAQRRMISGAKLSTDEDQDYAESVRTVNYKTVLAMSGDCQARKYDADQDAKESDLTKFGITQKMQHRVTNTNDVETNINFLDNTSLERMGGRIGSKYTQRYIDRDGVGGSMSVIT